jgi:hypothetical protein
VNFIFFRGVETTTKQIGNETIFTLYSQYMPIKPEKSMKVPLAMGKYHRFLMGNGTRMGIS